MTPSIWITMRNSTVKNLHTPSSIETLTLWTVLAFGLTGSWTLFVDRKPKPESVNQQLISHPWALKAHSTRNWILLAIHEKRYRWDCVCGKVITSIWIHDKGTGQSLLWASSQPIRISPYSLSHPTALNSDKNPYRSSLPPTSWRYLELHRRGRQEESLTDS